MRKSFCTVVLASLLTALCHAAEKPSVDSILDRFVKEVGGKEAVEKTKSLQIEGQIELGGAAGDFKRYNKAPNKTTWTVDLDGGTYAQGYDGSTAWKKDPNGVEPLEERELRAIKRDGATPEETSLKTVYPDLKYAGTEMFNGEEAHILENAPSPGISNRLAFSTRTGLLIGRSCKDGDVKSVMKLSDYKKTDGVLRPHTISERIEGSNGSFEYTLKARKYTPNAEIKDEVFTKPKS